MKYWITHHLLIQEHYFIAMLTMSVFFFSYRSIKEIPKFKNKATEYNQVSKIWRKKEKRYLGHRIFD